MKQSPLAILDEAYERFEPTHVIAMFSGGHDSLVATHIAKQHPKFSFALHINTGIGIEDTRNFVRDTCEEWGIELREYHADKYVGAKGNPDPQVYEDMVKQHGFPGAGQHSTMYNRLKERPLRQAIRELKRGRNDKTMLITGVRSQESKRRTKHVEKFQIWEGTKVWVAPIWQFSKGDVNNYIKDNLLSRNEVVDHLHSSGECLCGAYAHEGEKEEIRLFFPEMGLYLDQLEEKVHQEGYPWNWEDGPPKWYSSWKKGQQFVPGLEPEDASQMLCRDCENRHAVLTPHDTDG